MLDEVLRNEQEKNGRDETKLNSSSPQRYF